jgi:hypothetical membrane protein
MNALVRRRLGLIAAAGPLAFAIAWVVSAAQQPGYRPLRDEESALASIGAAHPWITVAGELLLGGATLALAAGLARALSGRDVVIASSLLAATGLAIATQALAREDCVAKLTGCAGPLAHASWHQDLHDAASSLAFVLLAAPPLILARPFRSDPHWHHLADYCVATAATGLLLLVTYIAAADTSWAGLAELLAIAIPLAWLTTIGLQLNRPRAPLRTHDTTQTARGQ